MSGGTFRRSLQRINPGVLIFVFLVCFDIKCQGRRVRTQEKEAETRTNSYTKRSIVLTAPANRVPYMCSLQKKANGDHFCGGVLLADKWVMTAAHCVSESDGSFSTDSLIIRCGIRDRRDKDPAKTFKPKAICIHHKYAGVAENGSDIALVKLNRKATSEFPIYGEGEGIDEDDRVFAVVGWSVQNEKDQMAKKLQIAPRVSLLEQQICNAAKNFDGNVLDHMICAGNGTRAKCVGDSGGPLIKLDAGKKRSWRKGSVSLDRVVGLMSYGKTNSRCKKKTPVVYTRVQSFAKWIRRTLENGECLRRESSDNDQKTNVSSTLAAVSRFRGSVNDSLAEAETNLALSSAPSPSLDDELDMLSSRISDEMTDVDLEIDLELDGEFEESPAPAVEKEEGKEPRPEPPHSKSSTDPPKSIKQPDPPKNTRYPDPPENEECFETIGDEDYEKPPFCTPSDSAVTCMYSVCVNPNSDMHEDIMEEALEMDNADLVQKSICCGVNANAFIGYPEYPLLCHAARLNAIESTKVLLKNDANVDVIDDRGLTAAAHAAEKNSLGVLMVLICCGIDVNKASDTQLTPLHIAAAHGHITAVKILLTAGALKTNANANGEEPVNMICHSKDCSMETTTELRELLS